MINIKLDFEDDLLSPGAGAELIENVIQSEVYALERDEQLMAEKKR